MKGLGNHFRDPLNLILSTLVVLSLLGAWLYAKEAAGIDYYVAWVAADAVKNDTPHDIYDPSSRFKLAVEYHNKADELEDAPRQKINAKHRRELPMTATPFLYWLTGVFAIGDYEADLDNWHAISIFILTISVLVMCRLLGYSTATSLAFLLPLLVWFSPFHSDLRVANVNSFQLGMIGLILWLQSRSQDRRYQFATGLLIGLLVMFKPNLAPVALMLAGGWALRRQYSTLAIALWGMATGTISALLVSSWWLGSATAWFGWLKVINQTVNSGPGEGAGNFAVVTQITGGISPLSQLILALFLCLLCLVTFWWGRRNEPGPASDVPDKDREMIENAWLIALGCIVAMLASALVWYHYYLLTIPMFVVVFRPWQEPGKMKALPVLMLRVLPALALVCLLDTAIRGLMAVDSTTYVITTTMISVLILFVIGLWQFGYGINGQRDRKAPAAPVAH